MPRIYDYFNYRDFINDFYLENKEQNRSFSFQYFADRTGFKSKSFIKLVIDGKKNLTLDSINKINKVLKLREKAFSYFCILVKFNQSSSSKERDKYFNRLLDYNKRNPAKILLRDKYEFYSKWYHNTLRELITFKDFKDDYTKIGKMVHPPLTVKIVKESINLLKRLKLIKKTPNGYIQTDSIISTGNEVRSQAVQSFHKQNLELASNSIDLTLSPQRDISSVVLGLSEKGFKEIKDEVQQFRKRLLKIAQKDKKINKVYHINVQLFPTSKSIDQGEV